MGTIDIDVIDYGPQEVDKVLCQDFVDNLGVFAEENLREDRYLDTAIFIYTVNKKLLQLTPDLKSVPDVQMVYKVIEDMYSDCLAFCMVNEGYAVIRDRDNGVVAEDIDLADDGIPCLIVQLKSRDGRFWIRQRNYYAHTNSKGEIELIEFSEDIYTGSHSDGHSDLLGGILDPWRESGPAPVR